MKVNMSVYDFLLITSGLSSLIIFFAKKTLQWKRLMWKQCHKTGGLPGIYVRPFSVYKHNYYGSEFGNLMSRVTVLFHLSFQNVGSFW